MHSLALSRVAVNTVSLALCFTIHQPDIPLQLNSLCSTFFKLQTYICYILSEFKQVHLCKGKIYYFKIAWKSACSLHHLPPGLTFKDITPARHRELGSDQRGKLVINLGWKESSLPPMVAHKQGPSMHNPAVHK